MKKIINQLDEKVNNSKESDSNKNNYTYEYQDEYFKELRNKPYYSPATSDDLSNYCKNLAEKISTISTSFFLVHEIGSKYNVRKDDHFICKNHLICCRNEFNIIVDAFREIGMEMDTLIDNMEIK